MFDYKDHLGSIDRTILEKEIEKLSLRVEKQKEKYSKMLECHYEKEKYCCINYNYTSGLKQSASRTRKEKGLENKIKTYSSILDNLKLLCNTEFKTKY